MVACFHPHANTPVFTEEQIDLLMANTNPELVTLCLDTAHTTLAGMDPVKAFDKYADRLGYVHLKDVDPDESVHPEWPMKRFRPLGVGTVDFKGIYNCLLYTSVLLYSFCTSFFPRQKPTESICRLSVLQRFLHSWFLHKKLFSPPDGITSRFSTGLGAASVSYS